MKKIILLMLLAFSSTKLVYADELDNKIETYKNVYTQLCYNCCVNKQNQELLTRLQKKSISLYNEISNICEEAYQVYLNDRKNRNPQFITSRQIWENLHNKLHELDGWKIEKRFEATHLQQKIINLKDFNPLTYLNVYSDLQRAATNIFGIEKIKWATNHYSSNGQIEPGRNYLEMLPANFNPLTYLSVYSDLQIATENMSKEEKKEWAIVHYLTMGKNEPGRNYLEMLPSNFNPLTYLSVYSDLQTATENMSEKEKKEWAIVHYLTMGKYEPGRNYLKMLPSNFNPLTYLSMYSDLQGATENMSKEEKKEWAIVHYLNNGRYEGRLYSE